MSTNLASSPRAYRQSAILTAPPEQLVVMLYDGARRFLSQAAATMRTGDVQATHFKLRRAEDIIVHLRRTLDLDQEPIAGQLQALYFFCERHLNAARLRQDPTHIDEVSHLLGELRESWAAIARG